MANLIEQERNGAEAIELFSFYPGTKIVELTTENVSKAMAIIQLDANYAKANDPENIPSQDSEGGKEEENFNLGGSSAFWFSRLREKLISSVESDYKGPEYSEEIIVRNCVNAVDRENSTHLNADGVGRKDLSKRLLDLLRLDRNQLLSELENPKEKGYSLISKLSEKTKINQNDGKHKSRVNLSFASKFCQIACYWLFDGKSEQDNFSKYDAVVKNVLISGIYQKSLGMNYNEKLKKELNTNDVKCYEQYQKIIDEIRKGKISRHGFDQLVWYYYKGKSEKELKKLVS